MMKPIGLEKGEEEKYDPTKVSNMIEFIKKERESQLEGKIADRQIKVFNSTGTGANLKQLLFKIDEDDYKRMKEMRLSEEKLEQAQGQASALKFLGEMEKKSKFQNKRYQELEKLVNSPNHTRSNVRIKFADGYVIQGTFGAKEKVSDIYDFVRQNLSASQVNREFELYETPPKRVLDQKTLSKTLVEKALVPSCMIYHSWKDLPETKHEHGPFLDMMKLKDKIVHFWFDFIGYF